MLDFIKMPLALAKDYKALAIKLYDVELRLFYLQQSFDLSSTNSAEERGAFVRERQKLIADMIRRRTDLDDFLHKIRLSLEPHYFLLMNVAEFPVILEYQPLPSSNFVFHSNIVVAGGLDPAQCRDDNHAVSDDWVERFDATFGG